MSACTSPTQSTPPEVSGFTWVIEPQFDFTFGFSDGLAMVVVDDKRGYIDTSGNMVIEPQFDYAFSFTDGIATASIDGKWGFIALAKK